jgi:hypothetical protein
MDLCFECFVYLRNRSAEPDRKMPASNQLDCKPVRPQPAYDGRQWLL